MKIILTTLVILLTLYVLITWYLYKWFQKENQSVLEKIVIFCVVSAWPVFLLSTLSGDDERSSDSV